MIFIGNGALLKRAINYTFEKGYYIDTVFSNSQEVKKLCSGLKIPFRDSNDINSQAQYFQSSDKIVFSINNNQILQDSLLSLPGYRFYNIHNGILPKYRGLPEVCIIYALLNKEPEYGVSLHRMDNGIDTGSCYGIRTFPLTEGDTFQSVMLKGIDNCHQIFKENLKKVLNMELNEIELDKVPSRLYTYKDLQSIQGHSNKEALSRALYFGVFKLWYKRALEIAKERVA